MCRRLTPIFYLLFTIFFFSCASNEIGNGKDVNPETIFFDYRINGEEGDSNVTVLIRYRFAGPNGTTLLLEEPSRVELDGTVLPADSSKMTGAFYEMIVPLKQFTGKHTIVFTNRDNKQYREEFSFQPITLRADPPDTLSRGDLLFELDGLDPEDHVRIILSDTSFSSKGINRLDMVEKGRVLISRNDLQSVVNGPVHLELYREMERPVKESTKEGGRLSINYGLKRDFFLKD